MELLTPSRIVEYPDRMTIAHWGGYDIDLTRHIDDIGVVMTPQFDPSGFSHGWCFETAVHAILSVAHWDPATQSEPPGYASCYTKHRRRRAGETAGPRMPFTRRTIPAPDLGTGDSTGA